MTDELARQDRTRGLAFFSKSQLLTNGDVARAMKRMAHEIVERNHGATDVVLVGLERGGVAIAKHIGQMLTEIGSPPAAVCTLDVTAFRDDLEQQVGEASTSPEVAINERVVIVIDDVLFTGRTVRAALVALSHWGRPASVQLAVLVDRGHRELPIRPDFVGKNVPTSRAESIKATLEGVWLGVKEAQ